MPKRKPMPEMTDEEIRIPLLSDASDAFLLMGEIARSLYKQMDSGTLAERQETIRLYNRAVCLMKSARGLQYALILRSRAGGAA